MQPDATEMNDPERELRRIYDDAVREPIPRDYFVLLRRVYDEAWIFPIIWAPEKQREPGLFQRFRQAPGGFFRALRNFPRLLSRSG